MASLLIDLDRREDLELARRMIDERLGTPGSISASSEESPEAPDVRPESQREAELVDRLWERITTDKTKDLLKAFGGFDGPFTLREVAERMDASPETVRAQMLRLGRSRKRLRAEFGGIDLFAGKDWDGEENRYTLRPGVREAIRKKAAKA